VYLNQTQQSLKLWPTLREQLETARPVAITTPHTTGRFKKSVTIKKRGLNLLKNWTV